VQLEQESPLHRSSPIPSAAPHKLRHRPTSYRHRPHMPTRPRCGAQRNLHIPLQHTPTDKPTCIMLIPPLTARHDKGAPHHTKATNTLGDTREDSMGTALISHSEPTLINTRESDPCDPHTISNTYRTIARTNIRQVKGGK
jgi:hypothetical protein